jgi:hypothetical protein
MAVGQTGADDPGSQETAGRGLEVGRGGRGCRLPAQFWICENKICDSRGQHYGAAGRTVGWRSARAADRVRLRTGGMLECDEVLSCFWTPGRIV